jgi:hypothetical protein
MDPIENNLAELQALLQQYQIKETEYPINIKNALDELKNNRQEAIETLQQQLSSGMGSPLDFITEDNHFNDQHHALLKKLGKALRQAQAQNTPTSSQKTQKRAPSGKLTVWHLINAMLSFFAMAIVVLTVFFPTQDAVIINTANNFFLSWVLLVISIFTANKISANKAFLGYCLALLLSNILVIIRMTSHYTCPGYFHCFELPYNTIYTAFYFMPVLTLFMIYKTAEGFFLLLLKILLVLINLAIQVIVYGGLLILISIPIIIAVVAAPDMMSLFDRIVLIATGLWLLFACISTMVLKRKYDPIAYDDICEQLQEQGILPTGGLQTTRWFSYGPELFYGLARPLYYSRNLLRIAADKTPKKLIGQLLANHPSFCQAINRKDVWLGRVIHRGVWLCVLVLILALFY